MTDDSDGGLGVEAITSSQWSTAIASDGVGETMDALGPQAVTANAMAPISNHAQRANGRGPTDIGTRIRE
jgi:hypothetical protein